MPYLEGRKLIEEPLEVTKLSLNSGVRSLYLLHHRYCLLKNRCQIRLVRPIRRAENENPKCESEDSRKECSAPHGAEHPVILPRKAVDVLERLITLRHGYIFGAAGGTLHSAQ